MRRGWAEQRPTDSTRQTEAGTSEMMVKRACDVHDEAWASDWKGRIDLWFLLLPYPSTRSTADGYPRQLAATMVKELQTQTGRGSWMEYDITEGYWRVRNCSYFPLCVIHFKIRDGLRISDANRSTVRVSSSLLLLPIS